MTGFEGQQDTIDGLAGFAGTASNSATQARTGTRSARCNPASGAQGYVQMTPSASFANGKYTHFGVFIATSLPSANRVIFGAAGSGVQVRLNTDGTLTYRYDTTDVGSSSTALTTNTWYWIGVRCVTGTSVVLLQINGSDAVTGSATVTIATANYGCHGTEAAAIDLYIDDIISDDAGFLSPSKVALLLPISDNARGANWFQADGTTTTNLWQGVDNTPPAGVASANEAANPTASIRHTGGANNSYDANLTTYATAGVAAGDTVIAIQSQIRHGEDIATGTKLLAFGLTSNPSESLSSSFSAGENGGAHVAESGAWVSTSNALITSPTVTIASSPVLRVNRPETASRVACVDFMAAYMAWTPAVVAAVRIPRHPGINHQNPGIL